MWVILKAWRAVEGTWQRATQKEYDTKHDAEVAVGVMRLTMSGRVFKVLLKSEVESFLSGGKQPDDAREVYQIGRGR